MHARTPITRALSSHSPLPPPPAQYASVALDYAWFAGSTALLLAIPVLIEIQRETTVMVMQRQREAEIAQIQEQAKMQHGGFVEQMKGLGALVSGSAGGGAGGQGQ